jgi:peptidoglycan hydrolase-like protein with peptidoglycan-binding domain
MKFGTNVIASLGLIAGLGTMSLAPAGATTPMATSGATTPTAPASTAMPSTAAGATTPMAPAGAAKPAYKASNMSMTTPQTGKASMSTSMHQASAMKSVHRVAVLQEALDSTGANIKIDGVWGPATEAALKHYQKQSNLPVTGKLDKATQARLDPIG